MTVFQSYPVLIPLTAIFLAEFLKTIISSIQEKRLTLNTFLHAGGMPSGHSAFVSSLTTLVYLKLGLESIEFAIVTVITIIVLYDAVNLRGEAGKHAKLLNSIQEKTKLEERLGHTYPQMIVGVVLGVTIACLLN